MRPPGRTNRGASTKVAHPPPPSMTTLRREHGAQLRLGVRQPMRRRRASHPRPRPRPARRHPVAAAMAPECTATPPPGGRDRWRPRPGISSGRRRPTRHGAQHGAGQRLRQARRRFGHGCGQRPAPAQQANCSQQAKAPGRCAAGQLALRAEVGGPARQSFAPPQLSSGLAITRRPSGLCPIGQHRPRSAPRARPRAPRSAAACAGCCGPGGRSTPSRRCHCCGDLQQHLAGAGKRHGSVSQLHAARRSPDSACARSSRQLCGHSSLLNTPVRGSPHNDATLAARPS